MTHQDKTDTLCQRDRAAEVQLIAEYLKDSFYLQIDGGLSDVQANFCARQIVQLISNGKHQSPLDEP